MIVMLCEVDLGYRGCAKYFPLDKEKPQMVFDNFEVSLLDEAELGQEGR